MKSGNLNWHMTGRLIRPLWKSSGHQECAHTLSCVKRLHYVISGFGIAFGSLHVVCPMPKKKWDACTYSTYSEHVHTYLHTICTYRPKITACLCTIARDVSLYVYVEPDRLSENGGSGPYICSQLLITLHAHCHVQLHSHCTVASKCNKTGI